MLLPSKKTIDVELDRQDRLAGAGRRAAGGRTRGRRAEGEVGLPGQEVRRPLSLRRAALRHRHVVGQPRLREAALRQACRPGKRSAPTRPSCSRPSSARRLPIAPQYVASSGRRASEGKVVSPCPDNAPPASCAHALAPRGVRGGEGGARRGAGAPARSSRAAKFAGMTAVRVPPRATSGRSRASTASARRRSVAASRNPCRERAAATAHEAARLSRGRRADLGRADRAADIRRRDGEQAAAVPAATRRRPSPGRRAISGPRSGRAARARAPARRLRPGRRPRRTRSGGDGPAPGLRRRRSSGVVAYGTRAATLDVAHGQRRPEAGARAG